MYIDLYVYIYIYIERERNVYIYIYIHIIHLSTNRYEILRSIKWFSNISVCVSSNWGPLTASFQQYPWNPRKQHP